MTLFKIMAIVLLMLTFPRYENLPKPFPFLILIGGSILIINFDKWLARAISLIARRHDERRSAKETPVRASQWEAEDGRRRISTSLRYFVMNRDHFRCVLCGATATDGAKLQVVHIKPVLSGGKTEEHNLITLCDKCSLGKGILYDYKGDD